MLQVDGVCMCVKPSAALRRLPSFAMSFFVCATCDTVHTYVNAYIRTYMRLHMYDMYTHYLQTTGLTGAFK